MESTIKGKKVLPKPSDFGWKTALRWKQLFALIYENSSVRTASTSRIHPSSADHKSRLPSFCKEQQPQLLTKPQEQVFCLGSLVPCDALSSPHPRTGRGHTLLEQALPRQVHTPGAGCQHAWALCNLCVPVFKMSAWFAGVSVLPESSLNYWI